MSSFVLCETGMALPAICLHASYLNTSVSLMHHAVKSGAELSAESKHNDMALPFSIARREQPGAKHCIRSPRIQPLACLEGPALVKKPWDLRLLAAKLGNRQGSIKEVLHSHCSSYCRKHTGCSYGKQLRLLRRPVKVTSTATLCATDRHSHG